MGFLDKAKAAATDLAAKADGALNNAGLGGPGGAPGGSADQLFRDLGRAVFEESKGAGTPGAKDRILSELHRLEQAGQLAGPGGMGGPPPPPGFNAQQQSAQQAPPPPGPPPQPAPPPQQAAPAPSEGAPSAEPQSAPQAPSAPQTGGTGQAPPPPPPPPGQF